MVANLYVDTSSVIRIATGDHDGDQLEKTLEKHTRSGALVVSSRLLELECRRAVIRLRLEGKNDPAIEDLVEKVELLPITDEVWAIAMTIPSHVKSLDALHLATCTLVPDCVLLTSDGNMRVVAKELGIEIAE